MQVVILFNLTHVLSHSLNTMSETIFSNSLIFQEFAKLKYTLNLKISKSQNLTNAKISWPKVIYFTSYLGMDDNEIQDEDQEASVESNMITQNVRLGTDLFDHLTRTGIIIFPGFIVTKNMMPVEWGGGGALPYKPIRDMPFFRVSFFSINS